ncbi:MAG: hypothetical protein ABIT16_06015 [Croceibacterium sp.]
MKRPLSVNLLITYLIVVFGISIAGSVVGAARSMEPYSTSVWLLLAVPKAFALAAGFAFLGMLRIGAYLLGVSVVAGWALAFALGTGFFPTFDVAAVVSIAIVGLSAWVIWKNWPLLKPLGMRRSDAGVATE